jgi:hypothetical protein
MKHPQVIVFAFDEWLGKQLRELSVESRWLVREARQAAACLSLVRDPRPAVLLLQADPHDDRATAFAFLADVHRFAPDVATVVVSDAKLGEDDRIAWTAAAFDLGARYVLFPPLSRPVIEDIVSGLMAAAVRRGLPSSAESPEPADAGLIDLAREGQADL